MSFCAVSALQTIFRRRRAGNPRSASPDGYSSNFLTFHGSFHSHHILGAALTGLASSSIIPSKLNGIKSLAMSDKEFKRVQQLHYGWYIQAVSALLGAMGKELYMKMDRNNRRAFVACLDNIDKEHDLQSGAQCLVKAFDKKLVHVTDARTQILILNEEKKVDQFQVKSYPYALHRSYYDFVGDDLKHPKISKKKKLIRKAVKDFARSRAAKLLKLNFTKKAQLLRNSPGQTKHGQKEEDTWVFQANSEGGSTAQKAGKAWAAKGESAMVIKSCAAA
ncbi:hypothetical protein ANCDUO_09022 [Ancylostoma duodenale]|uniref:Uncharacterized protein n=1 Tax=Ancylostoma duodenale TaxID=51022 RepID=A0A0C2GHP0_9BILA|nr:hypothetical protein ANCDUO_09022 [Ancylostoma duodenale]